MIGLLLKHGADRRLQDWESKTALAHAVGAGKRDAADMLR